MTNQGIARGKQLHPTLPDPAFIAACGRTLIDEQLGSTILVAQYDVIVIGAGVAGLTFALRLPEHLSVALLSKGALGESNTRWAQGGLAAAVGGDDTPELHEADTIAAGAGLCDSDAVHELVEHAPEAVEWLLSVGTNFDRDPASGALQLGREAAHSRRRVLHAGGDATGAEIERALVQCVRCRRNVDLFESAFAIDVNVAGGRCSGVMVELGRDLGIVRMDAQFVAIAAGGAGQLWSTTSNPRAATADGLAMALRAGVAVTDVEFVQFHPTVLAVTDSPPFLISEAVRGEGAYLRGADGERFMIEAHPLAELAPRDVVARGIQRQMGIDGTGFVHLDLRHLDARQMRERFPTIAKALLARGMDLAMDLIPVAPAAHYFMGGIVAGTDGSTSLPGLLALGEAACTGVHGANRLASNSLLEGLVFGFVAATKLTSLPSAFDGARPTGHSALRSPAVESSRAKLDALRASVQQTMSRDVAVVRDAVGLRRATAGIDDILGELEKLVGSSREEWETLNIALAARAISSAALLREESRGAHHRSDFPETDPAMDGQHIVFGGELGAAWRLSTLDAARSTAPAERGARSSGA